MEELVRLAAVLAAKRGLNDDEIGLYRAISTYIEMHYRLAIATLERQARLEGFTDDELRGYSPATS